LIRRRVRRWEDAYEEGSIDSKTLGRRLAELRSEEQDIHEHLRSIAAENLAPEVDLDGWAAMTSAERRAFIQDLIARVVLYLDGTVNIEWK